MSRMINYLDSALYPDQSGRWDDRLFRDRILRQLKPDDLVLDLGSGAGIVEEMNFKGLAKRVCGVDLDSRVEQNAFLDEGRIGDACNIPYPDTCFDVIYADNVMEHLDDPVSVFREVHRVLRTGGVFLFKTPNRNHYMPLIARMTPHGFHQFVNRLRGRSEADTFPTRYRANSLSQIKRLAKLTGFQVENIERIEGRPEYMRLSWPTYLIGAAYERIVNAFEFLAMFRVLLIAQLRKGS